MEGRQVLPIDCACRSCEQSEGQRAYAGVSAGITACVQAYADIVLRRGECCRSVHHRTVSSSPPSQATRYPCQSGPSQHTSPPSFLLLLLASSPRLRSIVHLSGRAADCCPYLTTLAFRCFRLASTLNDFCSIGPFVDHEDLTTDLRTFSIHFHNTTRPAVSVKLSVVKTKLSI